MQDHIEQCQYCARYDTVVRRGLLVLRNLSTVEAAPNFLDRLNARLYELDEADARAAVYRGPGFGSFIAAAASVVAAGFLAATVLDWTGPVNDVQLAPVVTMRPAIASSVPYPLVDFDFVAPASVGLPVWPAAMMAEQAPVYFADAELGR